MSVKIAIVGAGSASFGPVSVNDVLMSDDLAQLGVELVLMDIVADHLTHTEKHAFKVAKKLGRDAKIISTTSLTEALDGADFVITAIDKQRIHYWTEDFNIPRKYGFAQVFGENGGPGGIFHALRNMVPMIEIARTMEKLCPSALLLNFSNPEHKLCEAITRLTSIKNVGLCHGVFMGEHQISQLLGRPVKELELVAGGINHFAWFQTIRDKKTGEDLYPALREAERKGDLLHNWHELAMSRILFRRFGLWPSPAPNHFGEYIRWAAEFVAHEMNFFYDPADGKPWETGNTPEFIYSLTEGPHKRPWIKPAPQPPAEDEEVELHYSGERAITIIEAFATGNAKYIEAVNLRNDGAIPNLPDDMVVEIPATADADGFHRRMLDPLPEAIAAMLRVQGSINKLLTEAFAEKSKDKLIQAFLLDPTVHSYHGAIECIDEMLALQKDVMPELR